MDPTDPDGNNKKSMKMTVEFIYPTAHTHSATSSPVKKDYDSIKHQLHSVADTSDSSNPSGSGSGLDVNDLAILKSKYDTIVEYTVHLTAERDMIVTQLDVLKREYNVEMNKSKKIGGSTSGASPRNVANKKEVESKQTQV